MEDKKKIGVVTLYHKSRNYGGLLQAFALVHVLEKMGVDACQIDYAPLKKNQKGHFIKEIYRTRGLSVFFAKLLKNIINVIYIHFTNSYYAPLLQKRFNVMDIFRKNIPHTNECNQTTIEEISEGLDAFIVGSDQVWKPTVIDPVYSLAFSTGKPTMAYAASLSVSSIPEETIACYKEAIARIDMVSVREYEGQQILTNHSDGKPVDCVCDPTMLLSRFEWSSLSGASRKDFGNYAFCYFLGDSKEHRKVACLYAKKHNLKIVTYPNLMGKQRMVDSSFGDYQLYDSGPLDFVSLISNADVVFTDSFHATSFSVYMHTPFYVFPRDAVFSMNSRITSLLGKIGCMNRYVSPDTLPFAPPIEWGAIDLVLDSERQLGLQYIQRFLNKIYEQIDNEIQR